MKKINKKNPWYNPLRNKWAKEMNKHFTKGQIHLDNHHKERCLINFINHQESKNLNHKAITTTHLPGKLKIKQIDKNSKRWWSCRAAGTLIHCWWNYTLEKCLTVSTKAKHIHILDPGIPFLGRNSIEMYKCMPKETYTGMFTMALS